MARYNCVRCGQESNTLSEPHLCKDVATRLKETERRVNVPCQGTGSLDSWLKRMDHYNPGGKYGPKRPAQVWTTDHWGYLNGGTKE